MTEGNVKATAPWWKKTKKRKTTVKPFWKKANQKKRTAKPTTKLTTKSTKPTTTETLTTWFYASSGLFIMKKVILKKQKN